MFSNTDRIHPGSKKLLAYMNELRNFQYQIPTFQRNIVWEENNVKKLWDSICKFYPLGSILIWITDMKLQNHREVGGHPITDEKERSVYNYILDGQQRTTSLLTSLYGGKILSQLGFDPTLYIDLSVDYENEVDDESYKRRFLYKNEIDDTVLVRNRDKALKHKAGVVVKLLEVCEIYPSLQERLFNSEYVNKDFNHPFMKRLGEIYHILTSYELSFIEIQGIQVTEVCQIFERINQAGKPLDIFDIVVAKTFQPDRGDGGFYLRDLIDGFRFDAQFKSRFCKLDEQTYLQIIAVIIMHNIENSSVYNITERYLNEITTDQIRMVWDDTKNAIKKTFEFFENHLHVGSEQLIPFRYFYLSIAAYFYKNDSPDYELLKKYFWYYSFHRDDLLTNTTHLNAQTTALIKSRTNGFVFEKFVIDKRDIRSASYSSRGRLSRAILALLSNARPRDWSDCERDVIVKDSFFDSDKPNLHHIFPTNSEYVLNNKTSSVDSNTLMNIVYITRADNSDISNRNPLDYIRDYDSDEFRKMLPTHLLDEKLLDWAKLGELPDNALEQFIETRVDLVIDRIIGKLDGIEFEVIDTK